MFNRDQLIGARVYAQNLNEDLSEAIATLRHEHKIDPYLVESSQGDIEWHVGKLAAELGFRLVPIEAQSAAAEAERQVA